MNVVSWYLAWKAAQFERACRDPARAQRRVLQRIVRRATNTAFFAELGLDRVPSQQRLEAFRRRVPVRTSAAFAPWLERARHGDWRAICPSEPFFFSLTAGSTGKYKALPVTRELKAELDRSVLVFTHHLYRSFPSLPCGKTQFIVGSADGGRTPGGVPQGFVSGFNYKNLPALLRRSFVVPYPVFTLEDPDDRNYAIGRFLVQEPTLRGIGAISPLNILNVFKALVADRERLLADLRDGGLTLDHEAPALLAEVSAGLRALPELADRLQRQPRWAARDLFPGLEAFVCWKSAGMSHAHDVLVQGMTSLPTLEMPLSASEGIFAIPMAPDARGGVAAVTGHFLEFLPEGGGAPLLVHEVEQGATYSLVVTTGGGLYRYDMEDLVRVTGFHQATPMLEFVSKASRQVSVSNERINEEDVTRAMRAVAARFGVQFSEFVFVPTHEQRYRVLVDEAELRGTATDWSAFARELDRALCALAKGYGFERDDLLLRPLLLCGVREEGLAAWIRTQLASSTLPNAQVKPLHLTPKFDVHDHLPLGGEYGSRA